MKPIERQSRDPDIIASMAALRRAASRARQLSIQTGTPFYVIRGGKMVDLNRGLRKRRGPRP